MNLGGTALPALLDGGALPLSLSNLHRRRDKLEAV